MAAGVAAASDAALVVVAASADAVALVAFDTSVHCHLTDALGHRKSAVDSVVDEIPPAVVAAFAASEETKCASGMADDHEEIAVEAQCPAHTVAPHTSYAVALAGQHKVHLVVLGSLIEVLAAADE